MTTGLDFWLRVIEFRGGLVDRSGETGLVLLPAGLDTEFQLPTELDVTDDPDVAREDGATFLGPGHPAIAHAADLLLAQGDVGVIQATSSAQMPDLADLEELARLRFPVAHGRIDLPEPAQRSTLDIVRLGALVRYLVSDEDHYQEQLERYYVVESRLPIADDTAAALLAQKPAEPDPDLILPDVTEAMLAAYQEMDAIATRRRAILARDVAAACQAELDRAQAYYAAALESVAKRRATATADRQAMLDTRAQATRVERARRLEEITAKYRGAHEIVPFRLHLLHLPVVRVQAQVRRGERRYPLELVWMPAAADFAPVRCPACGRHATLDAGKTQLGCISCQTKAPVIPPPRPPAAPVARPDAPPTAPAPAPSAPPVKTARPPAPAAKTAPRKAPAPPRPKELSNRQLHEAGDRLALRLWQAAAERNNRAMQRLIAPDTPMATAYRLFRSDAPAASIGIPITAVLDGLATQSHPHQVTSEYVTLGEVTAAGSMYPFSIVWRELSGRREIVQIVPFRPGIFARYLDANLVRQHSGAGLFEKCPVPMERLEPVAATLWRTSTPRLGLPTTVRALTSWWRMPNPDALTAQFPNMAVAAAFERAACYWGGGGPGGYEAAAQAYEADVEQVRKVGVTVQKLLKLTAEQPW
ncbi:MAG TPA: hypothetical protein VFC19_40845 [Candidatus Limnocylindrales bacterium]|nr:hypothetical protein [Candidatus Limnocylindrales bacterium]